MPRILPTRALLPLAVTACALVGCAMAPGRQDRAVDAYVRGQMLIDRGEYDQAIRELRTAVQINPKLAVAHTAMGDIHRRQGDLQSAVTDYERACAIDRYSYRPQYNLAVTYQFLADAAQVVQTTQEYLRKAVDAYLRALVIQPDDYDSSLNLSACYYQLNKLDLAEQYCKAAIESTPDRPEPYTNLGVIHDAQGRLDEAVADYKQALELDARQPVVLMNLGSTYVRQGHLKMAAATFAQAASQAPRDPMPLEQMAGCYYHLGEFEKCREAFQQAADIDPNNPRALRGLGVVYMRQYLDNPKEESLRDKALAAWSASLAQQPGQRDLIRLMERYTPKSGQGNS